MFTATSSVKVLRRPLESALTTAEVAARFGVSETAVHRWGRRGLIKKCYSDNLRRGLWDVPSNLAIPAERRGRKPRAARILRVTAPSAGQGAI